ncbi:Pyridoxal 4-dehydrogenase [Planctomycetes bacterium Poly30]|uniref:Pyridoxal 4-dehydrogenase n=1 Tax=Saltatorellus ferox TaxID=2528018 RepID=A0A518EKP5_9BACT|nr:Pyridoxal 4-dehydrogenase [Planctomycetes bacterium Poly30]
MEQRTLGSTDVSVTRIGLGTAPLAGMFEPVAESVARATVQAAIDGGIRFFDTAPWYGFGCAERRVGDALRDFDGPFVLSTKVGRLLESAQHAPGDWPGWPAKLPFAPRPDYGYDAVHRSFEDSLQRLGLARVDALFLHDIGRMTYGDDHGRHFEDAMNGGVRALLELRDAGKIGAIGIGVNEVEVLMEALDRAQWDMFLLAGRYTLLEQEPALSRLFPACERAGTSIVIGGAFNSGLLAGGGTYNYADAPAELIQRRDTLREACKEFDVALEAAALQFPLRHEIVTSVLMGCRSPEEVHANLTHATSSIPKELWEHLAERGVQGR